MEEGRWVTLGGRRIFIKHGQSVPSAMKESKKFERFTKQDQARMDDLWDRFTDINQAETKELKELIEKKERYNQKHNK